MPKSNERVVIIAGQTLSSKFGQFVATGAITSTSKIQVDFSLSIMMERTPDTCTVDSAF